MTNLIVNVVVGVAVFALFAAALKWLLGIRYIPHAKVGVVEKFWSPIGSLTEGRIVALNGEAGFQKGWSRAGVADGCIERARLEFLFPSASFHVRHREG